jgi:hypothetical protein
VDQPPNLPLGPFPKARPFVQEHLSTDVTWPRKWAQDFYWSGTTTRGIPTQPALAIEFRGAVLSPNYPKARLQPDHVPNNLLALLVAVKPPFVPPTFQEIYRKADRDFQQLQALSYLPGPVSEPFFSVDLPITFRAPDKAQDFFFQSNAIPQAAPFYQSDWPLFARSKQPHFDYTYSGITTRGIPGRTPIVPSEWPIPMPKRWVQDFYWSGNTTRTIPPAPAPFKTSIEYPSILIRRREQYSESYSSPEVLLKTPIYAPFYQTEWQEIYTRSRPNFLDVSLNYSLYPGLPITITGLIMPNVVGLNLWEALDALQVAGILVPSKIGYFGTFPVSVDWISQLPPTPVDLAQDFIVCAQSVAPGAAATVNQAITLSVYEPPTGVVFP